MQLELKRDGKKMVQVKVRIYGSVQGVFFRHSARKEAERLGLTGWVRNSDDGSVEAIAEGSKDKLEEFVAWCKKGPTAAEVEKVQVEWNEADENLERFEIV
ncbi:acylphosphatase [Candidatus Curtissbacteria bacterium]|nr:acylphosphatase [Candidatus Curtissbacteria bacterium]